MKAYNKDKARRGVRVGVDTGGTFTDFVWRYGATLRLYKVASTPADPSRAIKDGLRFVAAQTNARLREIEVVHGTTVGTNALLQRRGARAALVTTAGFADVLAIGRQARPALYDLNVERPEPLIPRSLRFEVRERVTAYGEVLEALQDDELATLVGKLQRARIESVAICLLFSFVRPAHERRIRRALAVLNVPLSVSHEILPEYREYERTSTIAINAYLQPLLGAYLGRLRAAVPALRVMQSSGGRILALTCRRLQYRVLLSSERTTSSYHPTMDER